MRSDSPGWYRKASVPGALATAPLSDTLERTCIFITSRVWSVTRQSVPLELMVGVVVVRC